MKYHTINVDEETYKRIKKGKKTILIQNIKFIRKRKSICYK